MNQLQPNKFILSLSGSNIDISIINIEEMTGYCEQQNRIASVVTEKKTYGELDKINYSLAMNYTKPKVRVINSKNKSYLSVYNSLSENYKAGLLIAENDTLSESISELLCNNPKWNEHDVDIMVCRSLDTMTPEELNKTDYMRITADPDFNPEVLQRHENILQEKILTLMIIQFFVNENYENVNLYLEKQNERFSNSDVKEYIDYYQLNKQLAYFVYYDFKQNKILNISRDTILAFIKRYAKMGIIPAGDEVAFQLAETLTVE